MASLILSGSTSGSVTLSSPAVSGTTTLTLPVQTGTVMVNGPAFSAYASATDSFTNDVARKVSLSQENFDTNSNYNTSTYRFTPTVAGYYQINAAMAWNGFTATYCVIYIYKNGTEYYRGSAYSNTANGIQSVAAGIVYLNGSTDYVELYGLQNSGTTQNNAAYASTVTYMNGCLVRGA